MFSPDDTIVAIATPPGRGGIGVVRISGPASPQIAGAILDRSEPLRPRHATLARVSHVDEVIATLFAGPHSYTGEDVVEISAHGSPVILRAIVDAAIRAGARLAQPGEFTFRAFLSGRLDLVQSEAVADLIDAATPLQARTAFDQLEGTLTRRIAEIDAMLFDLMARLEASLDFPDEGYHFIEPAGVHGALAEAAAAIDTLLADARHGRTIREGARLVVTGATNVGKSSVFNRLAGHERAIVTSIPGTTRDLVSEQVEIDGLAVLLVDTAGIRETHDAIEREGVQRARQAGGVATLRLLVLDQSEPLRDDDRRVLAEPAPSARVIVRNKTDRPSAWREDVLDEPSIGVSALTGAGFVELRSAVVARLTGREDLRDAPAVTNQRHIALLDRARDHLTRVIDATAGGTGTPEEFILSDVQHARAVLEEVTGKRTTDDLLRHIFERFCIGK
jgi:tRNA modification GTPase